MRTKMHDYDFSHSFGYHGEMYAPKGLKISNNSLLGSLNQSKLSKVMCPMVKFLITDSGFRNTAPNEAFQKTFLGQSEDRPKK